MSMSRVAVRLAAYEAVNPYALIATGPWPTMAGGNVYDSPIDPIESVDDYNALMARIEGKPIISVYTEEHSLEPIPQVLFPADQNLVTVVFEMTIAARGTLVVEQADGTKKYLGSVEAALTDRYREAMLDVLESQINQALDRGPSGNLFRKVAMETRHIHSVPQRADDKTLRLAARTLRRTVKAPEERWRAQQLVPPNPAPQGLDLLPEPLRTIAKALDPNSTGGLLCLDIAALIQQPAPLVPLQGVTIKASLGGEAIGGAPAGSTL